MGVNFRKDKTFSHRLQIFSSKNEALSTENTFSPTNVSPSDVFRQYFATPLGHTLRGAWSQLSLHSEKDINNAGSNESASLLSQQPSPAARSVCASLAAAVSSRRSDCCVSVAAIYGCPSHFTSTTRPLFTRTPRCSGRTFRPIRS